MTSPTTSLELSDAQKENYRKALLKKGKEISDKLAKVLAGQNIRLENIPERGLGESGLRPEEKLRAYLDLVMSKLRALNANNGTFGLCETCNLPLTTAELDNAAWATEHVSCLAKSR
jgi:RNA polymerase-binding transcription factor DksA